MRYVFVVCFLVLISGCSHLWSVDKSYLGKYDVTTEIIAYPDISSLFTKDGKLRKISPITEKLDWGITLSYGTNDIEVSKGAQNNEETCSTRGWYEIDRMWVYKSAGIGRCYMKSISTLCKINLDGSGHISASGSLIESGRITISCPESRYSGQYIARGKKVSG